MKHSLATRKKKNSITKRKSSYQHYTPIEILIMIFFLISLKAYNKSTRTLAICLIMSQNPILNLPDWIYQSQIPIIRISIWLMSTWTRFCFISRYVKHIVTKWMNFNHTKPSTAANSLKWRKDAFCCVW